MAWALAATASAVNWKVDAEAGLNGDGLLWGTAFRFLTDALASAQNGDQIWIKGKNDGVGLYYYPDEAEDAPGVVANDRASTFRLPVGTPTQPIIIQVLGGFAGTEGEAEVNKRRPARYKVVLSGDLLQNDGMAGKTMEEALAYRFDRLSYSSYADNAYNVVTTIGTNTQSVLDGVTIQGGHADFNCPGEVPCQHATARAFTAGTAPRRSGRV